MALDNTTTTIGAQAVALASIAALALAASLLTGCAEDKQSIDAAYGETVAQAKFNDFWQSTEGIERRNNTIDRLSSIFNIFNNNLGRNINVIACIQEAIDEAMLATNVPREDWFDIADAIDAGRRDGSVNINSTDIYDMTINWSFNRDNHLVSKFIFQIFNKNDERVGWFYIDVDKSRHKIDARLLSMKLKNRTYKIQ